MGKRGRGFGLKIMMNRNLKKFKTTKKTKLIEYYGS